MRKVVTVTVSPALDRTVRVERLEPGSLNRVLESRVDAGGKGINVARAARQFGLPVVALGLLPRGGRLVLHTLRREGIAAHFVPAAGHIRVNIKIIAPDGTQTELNERGPQVTPQALDRLEAAIRSALDPGDTLVLSGNPGTGSPPDLYLRLGRAAAERGAGSVVDCDNSAMRLALAAGPLLVKPNRHELATILGRPLPTLADVRAGAAELVEGGARLGLVSLGADGAILVTASGAWHAWPATVAVAVGSAVGAGDTMVAAALWGLALGEEPPQVLARAVAAGTAAAAQFGTEPCSAAAAEQMLPAVRMTPL